MVFSFKTVTSSNITDVSEDNFWSGVHVWIYRSHIINRKIIGVEVLETWEVTLKHDINDTLEYITEIVNNVTEVTEIKHRFNPIFQTVNVVHKEILKTEPIHFVVQFRKLMPRSTLFLPVLEILLLDRSNRKVIFIPSKEVEKSPIIPSFLYAFQLFDSGKLEFSVTEHTDCQNKSVFWLKTKVFPKVYRWCSQDKLTSVKPSLSQVSVKDFSDIYTRLKTKYGKKIVENWPESTDPSKYVYEDIGIAAYLMALWNDENEKLNLTTKQSFVDLGCGNGLLVHILASEGYPGIGIDVRKREIWNIYGPETKLIEKSVIPSDSNLFPEYDWIIGNHSDELTPWIPVIAARSSYKMRVFLLPCCCYTFNGKFRRPNANCTTYQSYLDFIEELCNVMGFNVCTDKLRIPSTKRVCFVCPSRNYDPFSESDVDQQRAKFIKKHSEEKAAIIQHKNQFTQDIDVKQDKLWAESFVPKEKKEVVRNCSTLDPTFIETCVKTVINILLKDERFIKLDSGSEWNCGGRIHMKDIANTLTSDVLSSLKSQFGGLQTLIRTHRNIFTECSGYVSLTVPSNDVPVLKKRKNKKLQENKRLKIGTKPCYFHLHHPHGCPLKDKCTFSHLSD